MWRKKKIAEVAAISAADTVIGQTIADAMEKVGKDGVITVEESNKFGIEIELVEGLQFDKGYLSPYMVTDPDRMEAVLNDPYIPVSYTHLDVYKRQVYIPPVFLCMDNAAMVASLGYRHYIKKEFADLSADVFSRTDF